MPRLRARAPSGGARPDPDCSPAHHAESATTERQTPNLMDVAGMPCEITLQRLRAAPH